MKNLAVLSAVLILGGSLAAAIWLIPADEVPTPLVEQSPAPTAPLYQPSEQQAQQPSPVEKPAEQDVQMEAASLPPGVSAEEAERKRRMLELDRAAQKRFDEAVAMDRIDPDRVDPSVRQLFTTLTLEPNFDLDSGREGFIDGMRIAEISGASPLAKACFKKGDRLVRFNGQPLEDPALVAHLFASLGKRFEVCAQRDGGEHCRQIDLAVN